MFTYIPSRIDSYGTAEIVDSDIKTRDICIRFMGKFYGFPVNLASIDFTLDEAKSFIMQLGDKVRELEEKKNMELREQNRSKLLAELQEENTLA